MLFSLLIHEPLIFLPLIIALLFSLTFHEVSHGIVASWLGDETAKNEGRLTFNPLAHLDPIGFIMLMTIGFGWGKPVPVNYHNLRNRKWGPAIVSMAGPISNLILVIFFGIIFKIMAPAGLNPLNIDSVINGSGNLAYIFLSFLILYNVILMVFNLIPIPPLDGSKVLFAALPAKYDNFKHNLETKGPIILLVILLLDNFTQLNLFSWLFSAVTRFFASFF